MRCFNHNMRNETITKQGKIIPPIIIKINCFLFHHGCNYYIKVKSVNVHDCTRVKYVEITLLTVSGYLTSINNKRLNS